MKKMVTNPHEAMFGDVLVEMFDGGQSRALGIAEKVLARADAGSMDDVVILARAVIDLHDQLDDILSSARDRVD